MHIHYSVRSCVRDSPIYRTRINSISTPPSSAHCSSLLSLLRRRLHRNMPAPPNLLERSRNVGIEYKRIHNAVGTYSPHTFRSQGLSNSLDPQTFARNLRIQILSITPEDLAFELINIDAPLANALRRVMLSDVPTVAIENVFVHNNTSIMHDEQLAHRLGLIPLKVDPSLLETWQKGDPVTPENTVKFQLDVTCHVNKNAPADGQVPPDFLYTHYKLMSGDIKYIPMDGQHFPIIPRPAFDDIVLCKMRPGQTIKLVLHATKNVGKEHAKWSPVSTAWYRIKPQVEITKPPPPKVAKQIADICPAKVFDIEDTLKVSRPTDCTMCRECIRNDPHKQYIQLSRRRDHFMFQVESDGSLPPTRIVLDAFDVLIHKCDTLLTAFTCAMAQRTTTSQPQPMQQ